MKTTVMLLCWQRLCYSKISFSRLLESYLPFHLIVADNGSTDGTAEWMKDLQGNDRVSIEKWSFPKNFGRFRVCNLFFHEMLKRDCKYLGYVFNDTAPDPSWLRSFVDIMDSIPEIGMVFPAAAPYRGHDAPTTINGRSLYTGGITGMSDGFALLRAKVFTDRIAAGAYPYMPYNTYGWSEGCFHGDIRTDGWTIVSDPTVDQTWASSIQDHNGETEVKKHVVLVKRRFAVDSILYQLTTSGLLEWTQDGVQKVWTDEPFLSRRTATSSMAKLELKAELDPGVQESDIGLL